MLFCAAVALLLPPTQRLGAGALVRSSTSAISMKLPAEELRRRQAGLKAVRVATELATERQRRREAETPPKGLPFELPSFSGLPAFDFPNPFAPPPPPPPPPSASDLVVAKLRTAASSAQRAVAGAAEGVAAAVASSVVRGVEGAAFGLDAELAALSGEMDALASKEQLASLKAQPDKLKDAIERRQQQVRGQLDAARTSRARGGGAKE